MILSPRSGHFVSGCRLLRTERGTDRLPTVCLVASSNTDEPILSQVCKSQGLSGCTGPWLGHSLGYLPPSVCPCLAPVFLISWLIGLSAVWSVCLSLVPSSIVTVLSLLFFYPPSPQHPSLKALTVQPRLGLELVTSLPWLREFLGCRHTPPPLAPFPASAFTLKGPCGGRLGATSQLPLPCE